MTALSTKERVGSIRVVRREQRPLAASIKAIKGGLAACDADGFYCPATGATTEVVVGRFTETVDNTAGADGAKKAEIDFFRERTLFLLVNDTGTAVLVADRERACYVLDDQTVTGDDTQGVAGITLRRRRNRGRVGRDRQPRPAGPAGRTRRVTRTG